MRAEAEEAQAQAKSHAASLGAALEAARAEIAEVRAEVADVGGAKQQVRGLELAWQTRIDLDAREAERAESALARAQEALGASSAALARASRELRAQFEMAAPLQRRLLGPPLRPLQPAHDPRRFSLWQVVS